jgi:hypothetical protein
MSPAAPQGASHRPRGITRLFRCGACVGIEWLPTFAVGHVKQFATVGVCNLRHATLDRDGVRRTLLREDLAADTGCHLDRRQHHPLALTTDGKGRQRIEEVGFQTGGHKRTGFPGIRRK